MKQLQDEVVDLEDIGGGISITDLTLNDFRMDLAEYMKEHEEELIQLPIGGRSFLEPDEFTDDLDEGGVLFYLKSENPNISIDPNYAIAPYYLVYVNHNGEVELPFTKTYHRRIFPFKRGLGGI